jgi:PAT family beta-lactamase induction signal transducer AmpG
MPIRAAAWHRALVVVLLGFASGLPLALTGQAMQAWLSMEGLDVATIGFLSLVGLPYTFKFLWAPLMDRFDLPWLGRRRGWLVLTQLLLAGALFVLAGTSPKGATQAFALMAVAVAFIPASQDVVIDAYRTDLLPAAERGIGASLNIAGYRGAMILSGGIALIWTDVQQGGGWTWPEVYRFMAGLMVAAAVLSATVLPKLKAASAPQGVARNDLIGFVAVVAAVAAGYRWRRCGAAARCRWRCRAAGPTWWRCWWASRSRCRWPPSRHGARSSTPCCRAWRATSANAARSPSWC